MPFFGRKRTVSIDGFCQEYYDSEVFALSNHKHWWDDVYQSLPRFGASMPCTDAAKFEREIKAIRLEIFSVAWLDEFERGQSVMPQSQFTKKYLIERGLGWAWNAMGAYNETLAEAGTVDENGRKLSPAELPNQGRSADDLLRRWAGKGFDVECVERVGRRLATHIIRDGTALQMLTRELLERSGAGHRLDAEEIGCVSAFLFGFYKDARGSVGRISLRESINFRWL